MALEGGAAELIIKTAENRRVFDWGRSFIQIQWTRRYYLINDATCFAVVWASVICCFNEQLITAASPRGAYNRVSARLLPAPGPSVGPASHPPANHQLNRTRQVAFNLKQVSVKFTLWSLLMSQNNRAMCNYTCVCWSDACGQQAREGGAF